MSFDTLRDFVPISIAASAGLVLMACPSLPISSVSDMIALAKKKRLTYASSGYGSSQHVAAELLKDSATIDLTHVPYKGFGAAVGDAISCNVDLIFGAISTGIPHVRAGKLKPIAVTQPKRHAGLPDTPTFGEAGHPGVVIEAYMGLLAPAGTPPPIVDKLYTEVAAILLERETAERLTGAGLDLVRSTPDQYAARIRADLVKYAKLSKALAAKAE
jgi:tripartite-type tricarboxylate transporter receptor subunit TctC